MSDAGPYSFHIAATDVRTAADGFLRKKQFDGERAAAAWLITTPFLWFLGVQVLLAAALVFALVWNRWPTDWRTNIVVLCWGLVFLCQAFAVAYNWDIHDESPLELAGRLLSFTVIGWGFLGLAVAGGSAWELSSPRMIRAIMVFTSYTLALVVVSLAIFFILGVQDLELTTPVRFLLGSRPAIDFYAGVTFYQPPEASLGLPRMVLFFPWKTCFGYAGIAFFVIALCERDPRWRTVGLTAGIVAVVFSFSRAAVAALPISVLAVVLLRAGPKFILLIALSCCALALGMIVSGSGPTDVINGVQELVRSARPNSSQARDLIYDHSWWGFLDSPIFGQGWVGESILRQETLPIGSHSSVYGTLYTGGAITFASLAFAALMTLGVLIEAAIRFRTPQAAAAVGLMAGTVVFSYGEAMYSVVLPCIFIFLFIGGALSRPSRPDPELTNLSARGLPWFQIVG
jgi:hypothetical protein